ncbi:MAG: ATP-binding protein [Verrucomicrobiota bacterium]|nr:ATP-binding protein [Verrucomicrobiota bacterium]
MTFFFILLIAILFFILIFQRRKNQRRIYKLAQALKSNDRKLLTGHSAKAHYSDYQELENLIIDQIFEAETLEKRVERREDLISAVVDGLGDSVIVFDQGLKIRFTNPSACKLFGWASPPLELSAEKYIKNTKLIRLIQKSINTQRIETIEIQHQIPNDLNHSVRTLEVEVAPLTLTGEKSVTRTRVVLRDVTDARNLDLVRKDFVANASHELRTPLTIINGYLENLIDSEISDKDNSLKFLRIMQKHGNRIARIIEDMLTISKLESHSETIQIRPFDLRLCTEEVITRLNPLFEEKKAEAKLEFPDDSSIQGDVFYWDQILFNLIENALKENDEPNLKISISLNRESEHEDIITVKDDGVGMPAEALEFIFKRFYRIDQSHGAEKKGTGLGLSIVKRAIEAHDGEITVSSTPGIVTAFTITIPRKQ